MSGWKKSSLRLVSCKKWLLFAILGAVVVVVLLLESPALRPRVSLLRAAARTDQKLRRLFGEMPGSGKATKQYAKVILDEVTENGSSILVLPGGLGFAWSEQLQGEIGVGSLDIYFMGTIKKGVHYTGIPLDQGHAESLREKAIAMVIKGEVNFVDHKIAVRVHGKDFDAVLDEVSQMLIDFGEPLSDWESVLPKDGNDRTLYFTLNGKREITEVAVQGLGTCKLDISGKEIFLNLSWAYGERSVALEAQAKLDGANGVRVSHAKLTADEPGKNLVIGASGVYTREKAAPDPVDTEDPGEASALLAMQALENLFLENVSALGIKSGEGL